MSKKIKILSQSGVSLIQVMIVGAMMVGIAVVGMKIMDNQSKMNRGAQQSAEATSFYSLVTGMLAGKNACTNTFTDINTAPNAFPAMGSTLVYNAPIKDARGNDIFLPGTSYGALNFVGMEIINDAIDLDALAANNDSGIIQVRLNFRREADPNATARSTFGGNEFSRTINLFVTLDPATQAFVECYDISENLIATVSANICTDLGGVYNPDIMVCEGIFSAPESLKAICEGLEFIWDEVEEKCNKYVRGGHYGGCSKELLVDTTFKGTYNQVWPILNCSTNPPTCDAGFKAVQLAGGLVNVTPFGDLRAEMSTIWETWACAKE